MTDPQRPVVHYTPPSGWLNDPNGLVYHDGEYHMFYQHHPHSVQFGPMHWGHAVSTDLVCWTDLPIALHPDEHGTIYSGSTVVDRDDTAGFGGDALVAVYTQFTPSTQSQSVAWSTDRGRSWRIHDGNPVLQQPAGVPDFRDPKVFWHGGSKDGHWVMVLAAGPHIRLYTSHDLLTWAPAGVFVPRRADRGLWETPDLFCLPVADTSDQRWVLTAGAASGGPAGGSATRYWVGDFDGETFTADPAIPARWVDHGADFYAAQTWSAVSDGRRMWIAWMSNWDYADRVPAVGWRGQMTLPRELGLEDDDGGCVLAQRPAAELSAHLAPAVEPTPQPMALHTGAAWIRVGAATGDVAVVLRAGRACVRVDYDADVGAVTLDRTGAAAASIGGAFAAAHHAAVAPRGGRVDIDVLVDRASVEVFAQDGRVCLTDLVVGFDGEHTVSVAAEGHAIDRFAVREFDVDRAG